MATYTLTAPAGPYHRIDNRVTDLMPEITVSGYGIYSYLARVQNRITGGCFPSLKTIAKGTGLDKKTVIKYLKVLQKVGLVEKRPRHTSTGRRTSNQYDLLRFWEIAKKVVVDAFTAGKEPPTIPGIDPAAPSLEEEVTSRATIAAETRQAHCSHPASERRQPTADYAFCGLCYAELPILEE